MGWRILRWLWRSSASVFQLAGPQRTATGVARIRTATMLKRVDPKDPDSEEVFNFDCGSIMARGDTVASVESVFVQSGDDTQLSLLTTPAISTDGRRVSLLIGAGKPSSWYVLVCRFRTTALGELLDLPLEFYVKAA